MLVTGLVAGKSGGWEVSVGSWVRENGDLAGVQKRESTYWHPCGFTTETEGVGGWALEVTETNWDVRKKMSFLNLFFMEEPSYD